MPLTKERNVHLAMVGYGLLCDAKVQERSSDWVVLRLVKTTAECGRKGQLIRISQEEAVEVAPEKRLTKRRVVAKVFAVIGSVAASTAVAIAFPVSALVLLNPLTEGLIGFLIWEAVPEQLDYVVRMTCTDSFHCLSNANRQRP